MDGSSDARALLGMGGFVVLASTDEDGECFVLVETKGRAVGYPSCGVIATGHGRSVVQVRDLPMAGRATCLVWRKRRWLCPDPDCERRSFTEQSDLVEGSLTAPPALTWAAGQRLPAARQSPAAMPLPPRPVSRTHEAGITACVPDRPEVAESRRRRKQRLRSPGSASCS